MRLLLTHSAVYNASLCRYAKCPAGPQTTVASLLLVETNTVVV
mgnify:CR=1 FL=1